MLRSDAQESNPHPESGHGKDHARGGLKDVIAVLDDHSELCSLSRRIQHVNVTAGSADVRSARGEGRSALHFYDVGGGDERVSRCSALVVWKCFGQVELSACLSKPDSHRASSARTRAASGRVNAFSRPMRGFVNKNSAVLTGSYWRVTRGSVSLAGEPCLSAPWSAPRESNRNDFRPVLP